MTCSSTTATWPTSTGRWRRISTGWRRDEAVPAVGGRLRGGDRPRRRVRDRDGARLVRPGALPAALRDDREVPREELRPRPGDGGGGHLRGVEVRSRHDLVG